MKVTCPSCATRYRFPEHRVKARGAKMTCPKCSHSFVVLFDRPKDDPPELESLGEDSIQAIDPIDPPTPPLFPEEVFTSTSRMAALQMLATDLPSEPEPVSREQRLRSRKTDLTAELPAWAMEEPPPKRWPAVVAGLGAVALVAAAVVFQPWTLLESGPTPVVQAPAAEAPVVEEPAEEVAAAPTDDKPGAVASDPVLKKSPSPTPTKGPTPIVRRQPKAQAPIDVARQAVRDPVVTRKVRNSEPQRATTDFARQLLKVAQLKHAAGDWASAEDAYRKAIAKDTRCVECLEGLAQVLVAQNRKTEAVSYYEQAKAAETMKALKQ